jgi:hypothetical protein
MGRSVKQALSLTDKVRLGTTCSSPDLGSPTFDEMPFHVDLRRRPALGTYAMDFEKIQAKGADSLDASETSCNNYLVYVRRGAVPCRCGTQVSFGPRSSSATQRRLLTTDAFGEMDRDRVGPAVANRSKLKQTMVEFIYSESSLIWYLCSQQFTLF